MACPDESGVGAAKRSPYKSRRLEPLLRCTAREASHGKSAGTFGGRKPFDGVPVGALLGPRVGAVIPSLARLANPGDVMLACVLKELHEPRWLEVGGVTMIADRGDDRHAGTIASRVSGCDVGVVNPWDHFVAIG
jgi:hypothetical protein